MAIPGQANINIGAENQVAGSDTLYAAFHTIQNNFTTLFETSSPLTSFRAGDGVTVSSNVSNGVVSVTNTGVTKLTAGSGITVSNANGNVTISTIPQGPAGVTRVGLTSNSLSVTGGNIISSGNFTVDLPRITTGEHFATGEYIAPTLTVDGFGRITSIANGIGVGTVTSVGLTPGKGIGVSGGPILDSGAITVENTGVTSVQAGRGIQLSGSNGDITISVGNLGEGSVAYVGMTSNNLTITGGPVTSIGNFTVDLSQSFIDSLYSNATANSYLQTFSGNLAPNNIAATGNVTALNITASETLHANVVSANTFTGSFSGNATTAGTVTANAQPNITSTGTLATLAVTGNANIGWNLNLTGNANISGNINSYVSKSFYGIYNGIELATDVAGGGYMQFNTLNNDGKYVALYPPTSITGNPTGHHWFLPETYGTSSQVLGSDGAGQWTWKTPPAVGSNNQIQFNANGSLSASTGLTFSTTNGILTTSNLVVTGNASAANVLASTAMTAPRFVSNVTTASGTAPFTVSSAVQVANLNSAMAGTVVTNAQPNITSTGTLTSLTVSGNLTVQGNVAFSGANVSLGSNANVKISGGTNGQVLTTNGSGALTWTTAGGFDGSTVITISNTTAATSTTTGALKVSGGVGVAGNIFAGGTKHSLAGNVHITNATNHTLFVGPGSDLTTFTAPLLIMKDSYTTYVQSGLINSDANGSADWVAYADNGDDTQGWADMGMTSSTFNDANYTITGSNDGYFFAKAVAGSGGGGNLVIATGSTGTTNDIVFGMGGFSTSNIFARMSKANLALEVAGKITATGNITAANFVTSGSSGNITGANVISTNVLKTVTSTVSGLPTASSAGAGTRAFVSDANLAASGNFGAAISGSGANNVPVYSDGTSWRIG